MVKHYTAIWRNKDSGMSVNYTYYSRIDDATEIQPPATFIHNLLLIFSRPYSLFSVHFDIEYDFSALLWKQENLASSRNLTHPPELKNRAASHNDSLTGIL